MNKPVSKTMDVNDLKWFHSIEFGEGTVSPARFDKRPANFSLYGVQHFLERIDLTGMHCLDIGTVDGLSAFIMKAQGADRVVATDLVERNTFKLGREKLGLEIDYCVPAKIDTFDEKLAGQYFDLIVNAGILYHLTDPIGALIKCRRRLKPGGLMILETIHLVNQGRSSMYFCPNVKSVWRNERLNFYWVPSREAIAGMLEMASFEVLGYACSNERISVLAKAVRPSETKTESPMLANLLGKGRRQTRGYDEDLFVKEFEKQSIEPSSIRYQPTRFSTWIFPSLYATSLPFQPKNDHLTGAQKLWNYAYDAMMFLAHGKARLEAAIRSLVFH